DEAELLEIFGCDGECDGVSNRFVKTVIGAVLEERRLRAVSALIEIVAELVMYGDEVFFCHVQARLDAHVVFGVDVPGTSVADHLAVGGLGKQRALPESRGKRRKAK